MASPVEIASTHNTQGMRRPPRASTAVAGRVCTIGSGSLITQQRGCAARVAAGGHWPSLTQFASPRLIRPGMSCSQVRWMPGL